jgi:anaerobic magnesium-protoporphyrin IX monomethyl ester cyclase
MAGHLTSVKDRLRGDARRGPERPQASCHEGAPRVLLVNPPPFQKVEPYYDTPDYPRTALACLAGFLREQGIDVYVLDCKFDRLDYESGMEFYREVKPDIVGFTAFTNEIVQAATFAELVKAEDPDVVTVIGGVHVTALPERTMREFSQFDFGILGEGEETIVEFAQNFSDRASLAKLPGVCSVENDAYCFDRPRIPIADQTSLPFPAWDMFWPAREYIIQSSRGCPYACKFCMNPGGRVVRPRTPENVLDEIGWILDTFGAESISFGDEIFTIKRDRVMEICQGMIDRGYHKRVEWWCQTHVRTIDLELAELMRDANCKLVGLGIESGDEATLKKMGKGTSLKNIFDAVQTMKKAKLPFMTFFILGQPDETAEKAWSTVDFAVKLNPDLPIFGIMVPYPGTEIARMVANGEGGYQLLSEDWNDYNKQFGNSLEFENLPRKTLERIQFFGYLKVFIWNFRLIDLAKFIWTFRSEGIAVVKKQLGLIKKDLSVFVPFSVDSTRIEFAPINDKDAKEKE